MSCLSFGKKLVPSQKAWKGLATSIQKKLHKISRTKAAKRTRKRLNATLAAAIGGVRPLSLSLRRKKPVRRQPPTAHCCRHHQQRWMQRTFPPVYVDQLFKDPAPAPLEKIESTTKPSASKVSEKSVAGSGAGGSGISPPVLVTTRLTLPKLTTEHSASKLEKERVAERSDTAVSESGNLSPVQLAPPLPPGVDERAEAFILKFRSEMKLQRQRSFETYEEMLARGR